MFALSFTIAGVGSGSTGFGSVIDSLGGIFGTSSSSSGPSVSKAQARIKKNAKDAPAYLELAHAYEAKKDDISAIDALEKYVKLRPRGVNALSELAGLYETRAQTESTALQQVQSQQVTQTAPTFGPDTSSPLGQALTDPALQPATNPQTSAATIQTQTISALLQGTYGNLENTYKRLYKATPRTDPNYPSFVIQYGQAAQQAGDTASARAAYRAYLKQFPDDTNAPAIRQLIKQLGG